MSELWDEPEHRFQKLVDTLWYIAEQENDGDHIQATIGDLADLYKWYDGVLRPSEDIELTPEHTRVSFELAEKYGFSDVVYTLNAYEGYWIPDRKS